MRRLLFFVILLLFPAALMAQNVIKGIVTDDLGNPVPGARVFMVNTTYGVPTNLKGSYFLEVPQRDTLIVRYEMVGFEAQTDTFINPPNVIENDVVLGAKSKDLQTVEIYANKRDIAKEVIGKVIDNKKNMRNQFETFQCQTYIKTSLEKENRFGLGKAVDKDGNANEELLDSLKNRSKMNFIETVSLTKFKQKDTYKEVVIGYTDYAEKTNSSVTVTANFSDPNSLLPSQVIEYNPYVFFEKTQDGDFDLYDNLINLPKVSSRPLISPLAVNAFLNYKYTLGGIFYEDGQKIYNIEVEPRFNESPLFSGNLYIIDSLWVIKSMDLTINSSSMEFFKSFRLIHDYESFDGIWMPVRREFNYTINDGSNIVLANTRVHHEEYTFDIEFPKKTFNNAVMVYEEDAFDKDSSYWTEVRPIRLKTEELVFIREQDSIATVLESDEYVDSVNTEYNRITFWDIALNGVGFRNRVKKQEIYINPLIAQPVIFGIGGYRHRLGGFYSKEFANNQAIRVAPEIDYGFRNKDLKGGVELEYTYWPKRFGSAKVRVGDIYDFITMDQSLTDFFSRGNYVRKTLLQLSQRIEIVNGLYGRLTYDYSTRRDISDIDYAPWTDTLIQLGIWDKPEPYETYTVSIFELEFLYRFKQQYILKGNKKLVIGTEFPELRLTFKKGIPNMFGSQVDFNFLEIGASDKVNFGSFGDLKWNVEAGTFFGKTADEVQFIERKFFRGSDFFFFSNPLSTMQLLDSTFNTTRPYFQGFAIHHFNGAIMNKIPLINKLRLELVGGLAILLIEEENYAHFEYYAGIERKFKIKNQLFKLSAFYVVRDNNTVATSLNFKIGIDFFNSFTNEWSY